jgi:hypothetical protein
MNPRQLQSNSDLFNFLMWLGNELRARGETQLAEEVMFASRFAVGSASEFLHEAHQVLTKVANSKPAILTTEQSDDLKAVIAQIDEAFRKVGGA